MDELNIGQKRPVDHNILVRKKERNVMVGDGTFFAYRYESIAPTKRQKKVEPFIVTHLPRGKEGG